MIYFWVYSIDLETHWTPVETSINFPYSLVEAESLFFHGSTWFNMVQHGSTWFNQVKAHKIWQWFFMVFPSSSITCRLQMASAVQQNFILNCVHPPTHLTTTNALANGATLGHGLATCGLRRSSPWSFRLYFEPYHIPKIENHEIWSSNFRKHWQNQAKSMWISAHVFFLPVISFSGLWLSRELNQTITSKLDSIRY